MWDSSNQGAEQKSGCWYPERPESSGHGLNVRTARPPRSLNLHIDLFHRKPIDASRLRALQDWRSHSGAASEPTERMLIASSSPSERPKSRSITVFWSAKSSFALKVITGSPT